MVQTCVVKNSIDIAVCLHTCNLILCYLVNNNDDLVRVICGATKTLTKIMPWYCTRPIAYWQSLGLVGLGLWYPMSMSIYWENVNFTFNLLCLVPAALYFCACRVCAICFVA